MTKTREELLEEMTEAYMDICLEDTCQAMIDAVMPSLDQIKEGMEKKYGRPVIQYITSRVKTPESTLNKLVRKGREETLEKAVETFQDLAGIRVVCTFYDDVYRVVRAIRKIPDIRIIKTRDYIATPKASGYRSIHIVSEVPAVGKIKMEIQVCSAAMNYWAILDHELGYKLNMSDSPELKHIQKELRSFSFDIKDIDKKFLEIRKKIERL
ncbi:MAG: GTP pyrophosphokinase [Clostridiales bacterium]|nr:GTP pyrophosphokinase [Clostridiales bacterium]